MNGVPAQITGVDTNVNNLQPVIGQVAAMQLKVDRLDTDLSTVVIGQLATGQNVNDGTKAVNKNITDTADVHTTAVNDLAAEIRKTKFDFQGISKIAWNDSNIEENMKTLFTSSLSQFAGGTDEASSLCRYKNFSKYEEPGGVMVVAGKNSKLYYGICLKIKKAGWTGTIEDEWNDKKNKYKQELQSFYALPDKSQVVIVGYDVNGDKWLN